MRYPKASLRTESESNSFALQACHFCRCRFYHRFVNPIQAQIYRLSDRLYQEALSVPSKLAFTCANRPWVEKSFLRPRYHQAIARHSPTLPTLPAEEQTIVQALDQQGLYVTHLDDLQLPQRELLWQAGQQVTQRFQARSRTPLFEGKHTLTATAQDFLDHPILFTWAINEKLLRIAEQYFRLPVAYDGPSFYYSVGDGTHRGPRRWHRDKEDWKMLKVAIYFTDVDLKGGPFECVAPLVNQHLIQQTDPYGVFHHDEIIEQLSNLKLLPSARHNSSDDPESWYKSCTGSAGTVVFCDTSRFFHRGRPPVVQDRSAIFYSYFSRRPKHPFFCGRSPLTPSQIQQLSQDLPAHLLPCITWPQHLAPLARLIPKNRVRV